MCECRTPQECRLDPNVQDFNGDTALHDAARFGHESVAATLIPVTNVAIRNNAGMDVLQVSGAPAVRALCVTAQVA